MFGGAEYRKSTGYEAAPFASDSEPSFGSLRCAASPSAAAQQSRCASRTSRDRSRLVHPIMLELAELEQNAW